MTTAAECSLSTETFQRASGLFASVRYDLDTDASDGDLATPLRLTERYCVVLQTIAGAPSLRVEAAATQ